MRYFLETLKDRNEVLFWFGALCLASGLVFVVLTRFTSGQVVGVNAWFKPFKFAISIGILCWTVGWYGGYLNMPRTLNTYAWGMVVLLGFELVYIAFQAGRGQLSHFNTSSAFYGAMYTAMGIAATIVTLWTGYIGVLFFTKTFPALPIAYVWAIRMGFVLFVIFALEGFVMGSRMSHTIGGPDGEMGLPIVGWSLKYGDPRIAHFIGMHALQVLPFLAYYLLRTTWLTVGFGVVYSGLAVLVLVQALNGKPIYTSKNDQIQATDPNSVSASASPSVNEPEQVDESTTSHRHQK